MLENMINISQRIRASSFSWNTMEKSFQDRHREILFKGYVWKIKPKAKMAIVSTSRSSVQFESCKIPHYCFGTSYRLTSSKIRIQKIAERKLSIKATQTRYAVIARFWITLSRKIKKKRETSETLKSTVISWLKMMSAEGWLNKNSWLAQHDPKLFHTRK